MTTTQQIETALYDYGNIGIKIKLIKTFKQNDLIIID